jgi:hypothetical protein
MAIDLSPDLSAKISIWRQKSLQGTITQEEMKEAIIALRQSRFAAVGKSKETKKKAKTSARSADDLLSEL